MGKTEFIQISVSSADPKYRPYTRSIAYGFPSWAVLLFAPSHDFAALVLVKHDFMIQVTVLLPSFSHDHLNTIIVAPC